MMNVKLGTTTWSKEPQEPVTSTNSTHLMSATDEEKVQGTENVGTVLNKLADSNWVDPSKTRKVGNNQLDKDAFMKLMLTQMKYQDPSNPMQSHEMAAQLAQFSSLEQLSNINQTLVGMKQQASPATNYQALSFIGKKVSGDSSKLTRVQGDKEHDFHFTLSSDAAKAKIDILDAEGNTVRKVELSNLKKGENSIKWNGLAQDGAEAKPGDYRFNVDATTTSGGRVFVKTDFEGRITGLNYTPSGPILLVGQQAIRMSDVKRIEEAEQPNLAGAGPGSSIPGLPGMPGAAGGAPATPQAGDAAKTAKDLMIQAQDEAVKAISNEKVKPQADFKKPTVSSTQSSIGKSVGMSGAALRKYNEAQNHSEQAPDKEGGHT